MKKYIVTIKSPRWEMLPEKDGDAARMKLVLPGETSDGQMFNGEFLFLKTIISSGANRGKSVFAKSAENCIDIGMSAPFNPARISELEGVKVEFCVDTEKDGEKEYERVKFINPIHGHPITADDATRIWSELSGEFPDADGGETPDTELAF